MDSIGSSETQEQKTDHWKGLGKWFLTGIGGVIFVVIGAWALYVFGPPKDGPSHDRDRTTNKQVAAIEFENARPFVDRVVLENESWRGYLFKVQIQNKSSETTLQVKHLKLTDLQQLEGNTFKAWQDAEPVYLEWDDTKSRDIPPEDKVLIPFARIFPPELQRRTDSLLSGGVDIPQLRFTVQPGTWPRRMPSHIPPGTHRFKIQIFFENVPPAEIKLELEWSGNHREPLDAMVKEIKMRKL